MFFFSRSFSLVIVYARNGFFFPLNNSPFVASDFEHVAPQLALRDLGEVFNLPRKLAVQVRRLKACLSPGGGGGEEERGGGEVRKKKVRDVFFFS